MGVADVRFAKPDGKASKVTKHKGGVKPILNGVSLIPCLVQAKESQPRVTSVPDTYIQFTLKVSCSNSQYICTTEDLFDQHLVS